MAQFLKNLRVLRPQFPPGRPCAQLVPGNRRTVHAEHRRKVALCQPRGNPNRPADFWRGHGYSASSSAGKDFGKSSLCAHVGTIIQADSAVEKRARLLSIPQTLEVCTASNTAAAPLEVRNATGTVEA